MTEERVSIQPGALFVARVPAVVSTIVGSSAVVCLWSPEAAGVCHFSLPSGGSERSPRYANHALPMLLERMIAQGADRARVFASIYGGVSDAIGRGNVAAARAVLERLGIPVLREDAGGTCARKLTLRTVDGSYAVREIGERTA